MQKIEQILKNFLSNAIKFTEQGSVDLIIERPASGTVFKNKDLDCQRGIAFTVKDTGIGIAKDKQATIFEAFQQADDSKNRKYGGTGLGLSICVSLSKLIGGEMQVQSEPGKGSCFTLFIPEIIHDGVNVNIQASTSA